MAKRFIGNVKGVGISSMVMEFYLSSSGSVMDGGTWSEEKPTLGSNKYLWTRWKSTLTDGSIVYTTPVCDGVWEEIYGIYAVKEEVDGALDDITTLKAKTQSITNDNGETVVSDGLEVSGASTFNGDILINDSELETLWNSVFGSDS